MKNELTVTDIMKKYGYTLSKGQINLIVSPVSSGKTFYIFEELLKGVSLGRVIYLCDTSGLKQAVRSDGIYYDKTKYYEATDIRKLGHKLAFYSDGLLTDERVTVMTYAQFGRLLEKEPNCINNIDTIICDEAHNMIKFANRYDNYEKQQQTYTNVIETLKSQVNHKLIAFFTATPSALVNTRRFDDVKCHIYDFRNEPGIKKLKQANTLYFNHYMSLINRVADYDGFKKGYKAVIYTERIDTISKMEKELKKRGLAACGIWSIHNEEWKMSAQSLKTRESIIMYGIIPDDIDILIFNASYETGINIYDTRVEFAAINSKNADSCDQGRGRIRKDIDVLCLLDQDAKEVESIVIDNKWLNRALLADDKKLLAQELKIYDEKGRLQKWNTIQGKLVNSGYTISNRNERINGKMTRYSVIT